MGTRGKKTSDEIIARIIKMREEGLTIAVIAERIGLTPMAIHKILKNRIRSLIF